MQDCKTFCRKTNLSIVCPAVGWTSCLAVVHMPKLKSYCRGNDTVCSLVTGYCWQQGWKTEIFTVNGPRWSILSQSCTKWKRTRHRSKNTMEAITAHHTNGPDKKGIKINILLWDIPLFERENSGLAALHCWMSGTGQIRKLICLQKPKPHSEQTSTSWQRDGVTAVCVSQVGI